MPPKPRAKRRGCSATSSSRGATSATSCPRTISAARWRRKSAARRERRRQNRLQRIRAIAVLVDEKLIRDVTELLGKPRRIRIAVPACVLVRDRADRVHVLIDQRQREARRIRSVLDQAA